jgi:hypothetical protein
VGEMEGVGTFLNSTTKAKLPLSAHQNTSSPPGGFLKFFRQLIFCHRPVSFWLFFPKKSPKNQSIFLVIFLEKIAISRDF